MPLHSDRMRSLLSKAALLLTFAAVQAAYAEDLPSWLREATTRSVASSSKTAAIVLHDESVITIGEGGKLLTQSSRAVRILKREGASEAVARAIYRTDGGKFKEFRAWLIRPSGEVKKYGKNDVIDVALVNNDIYNEARVRTISGKNDADPGSIFAFDFELEDKSVFTQFERTLHEDIPVALVRLVVAVPAGWNIDARAYNNPTLKAAVIGGRHTWELRDLPALESEPLAPPSRSRAARIAVSAIPPGDPKSALSRSFSNWGEVANWLYDIAEPQLASDNALIEKAQSLTRNARNDWEKIRAIGSFVQKVQYVSIQTGLGRGGGYTPRPAILVLSRNYGDCKDKANLMRAMLKVVGVEGYPVVIYSGDRSYVHEDWPSPQQFNHCIFAARLKEDTQSPAVTVHPKLGRIVLFDPTDEHTPFGLLPSSEENSLALVVAPGTEGLLRTPASGPDSHVVERRLTGSLAADGSLTASIQQTSHGHEAAVWNRLQNDPSEFRKELEGWLSRFMAGAQVVNLAPKNTPEQASFEVQIKAGGFAQATGNLFIFRPAPIWLSSGASFLERTRTQPLLLESRTVNESFSLELPAGFKIDEIPSNLDMKSQWGSFQSTYSAMDGKVEVRRSLKIAGGAIPADQYLAAREFFGNITGSSRMPVVLVKK